MSPSRFLLAGACVLLALTFVCATTPYTENGSAANPNTPPNSVSGDPFCSLETLRFEGLRLRQSGTGADSRLAFASNHYHYTCTVPSTLSSTIAWPKFILEATSVEITHNGNKINHRSQPAPADGMSKSGTATSAGGQLLSTRKESQGSLPIKFVTGNNLIVVGVGCNSNASPTCYYQYTINCNKPGTSVTGDPQFVGLRGQSYQIHGVAGQVYNIVSDADLQYNSRFVFLNNGECPVVDGVKQKGCFSHPGSYLGQIGLKTRAGDRIHIVSGPANSGFATVAVNGKELERGETVILADELGSVSRNSTHMAAVQVGNWDFVFENSDMYINQKVHVINSAELRSHGLLGQTWRDVVYNNAIKHIEGNVDDYAIRVKKGEDGLWADNFLYNAFN